MLEGPPPVWREICLVSLDWTLCLVFKYFNRLFFFNRFWKIENLYFFVYYIPTIWTTGLWVCCPLWGFGIFGLFHQSVFFQSEPLDSGMTRASCQETSVLYEGVLVFVLSLFLLPKKGNCIWRELSCFQFCIFFYWYPSPVIVFWM